MASCALVVSLASVTFGCAAQVERARLQRLSAETGSSMTTCTEAVNDNPKYLSLKSKLYLGSSDIIPPELLSVRSKPESQDIPLIQDVQRDLLACRRIMLDGAARMHPRVVAVVTEAYESTDRLWDDLIGGRLTFGQFNDGRREITAQARQRLNSRPVN